MHPVRYQRIAGGVVFAAIGCGLVGLGVRLIQVNKVSAPRLREMLATQQSGWVTFPARRGSIFDVRGRVLAVSREAPSVYSDPSLLTDRTAVACALGKALHLDAGQVEETLRRNRHRRFCVIKRRVSADEARAVRESGLIGVGVFNESWRQYPQGALAAHTVGFVGRDSRGLEGIERQFDEHLRGHDGRRRTVRDARRRIIRSGDDPGTLPVDGGHIVLTIDSVIQQAAADALARQIETFAAESGVAVVMDPHTGDILANACWPTFEPDRYAEVPADTRRNRTITDSVEPGSTFKPFIAAAALERAVVNTTEKIDCHGGVHRFGGRTLRDVSANESLTLAGVVIHSSNVGMATIGLRLGNEAIHDAVRRFGFGARTGVELPGEDCGTVRRLREWTSYSTTSLPMGYEIAVTPLQLATAFAAIVNGGVLVKPRVVRARMRHDGRILEEHLGPEVVRRVLPEKLARYITDRILVGVVNEGGGRRASLVDYQVAGKTGTTRLTVAGRRGYQHGAYLSSFVGTAPSADPAVVALVMIRRPRADVGYYGGVVAAPAVRDILETALRYLRIPPSPEPSTPPSSPPGMVVTATNP